MGHAVTRDVAAVRADVQLLRDALAKGQAFTDGTVKLGIVPLLDEALAAMTAECRFCRDAHEKLDALGVRRRDPDAFGLGADDDTLSVCGRIEDLKEDAPALAQKIEQLPRVQIVMSSGVRYAPGYPEGHYMVWTAAGGDYARVRDVLDALRSSVALPAAEPVADVARDFMAYYTRREDGQPTGGCRHCGGLPHTATCFVGRFERALAEPLTDAHRWEAIGPPEQPVGFHCAHCDADWKVVQPVDVSQWWHGSGWRDWPGDGERLRLDPEPPTATPSALVELAETTASALIGRLFFLPGHVPTQVREATAHILTALRAVAAQAGDYAREVAAFRSGRLAGTPAVESRSVQRRKAAMQGEPLPTFTGDSLVADARSDQTPCAVCGVPHLCHSTGALRDAAHPDGHGPWVRPTGDDPGPRGDSADALLAHVGCGKAPCQTCEAIRAVIRAARPACRPEAPGR